MYGFQQGGRTGNPMRQLFASELHRVRAVVVQVVFLAQGAVTVGIAAMQDTSPVGLSTAGAAMAVLAFPPPLSSPSD